MITAIKPIGERILIKPDTPEEMAGGILLPQSAQQKSDEAVVVALGTSKKGFAVKVGDRVLTAKYCGTEVDIDGVKHVLCREDDLLGIKAAK